MYATFGVQCMVYKGMHRGPTWEYDEEYLDDADLLQQYLDAGTLINQDQEDRFSITAISAYCLIAQSQEDCICPQPGQDMDILSQVMAFTGITETAVDVDDMPIIAPCESGVTVSESPTTVWSSYQNRRVALEQLWGGTGQDQIAKMYDEVKTGKVKQLQQCH